ncbi:hypothetical protein [Pseudomonas sp. M20]|uniref:hypothetical protein n=1 Tax=Pseudomonas sp. M20 TaxID=3379129 RepID=UPI003862FDD6
METLNLTNRLRCVPLSILAEGFPIMLSAFNELVRELRGAGIGIKEQVLLENKVVIDDDFADLFVVRFGDCLSGIRYSSAGQFTCSSVTVRGVDVVWMTLARGQVQ